MEASTRSRGSSTCLVYLQSCHHFPSRLTCHLRLRRQRPSQIVLGFGFPKIKEWSSLFASIALTPAAYDLPWYHTLAESLLLPLSSILRTPDCSSEPDLVWHFHRLRPGYGSRLASASMKVRRGDGLRAQIKPSCEPAKSLLVRGLHSSAKPPSVGVRVPDRPHILSRHHRRCPVESKGASFSPLSAVSQRLLLCVCSAARTKLSIIAFVVLIEQSSIPMPRRGLSPLSKHSCASASK